MSLVDRYFCLELPFLPIFHKLNFMKSNEGLCFSLLEPLILFFNLLQFLITDVILAETFILSLEST